MLAGWNLYDTARALLISGLLISGSSYRYIAGELGVQALLLSADSSKVFWPSRRGCSSAAGDSETGAELAAAAAVAAAALAVATAVSCVFSIRRTSLRPIFARAAFPATLSHLGQAVQTDHDLDHLIPRLPL